MLLPSNVRGGRALRMGDLLNLVDGAFDVRMRAQVGIPSLKAN